jgi:hypothetical protein
VLTNDENENLPTCTDVVAADEEDDGEDAEGAMAKSREAQQRGRNGLLGEYNELLLTSQSAATS